jgi:hypothetical protein
MRRLQSITARVYAGRILELQTREKRNILSNVLSTKGELLCYAGSVETCGGGSVGDILQRLRASNPLYLRVRREKTPGLHVRPGLHHLNSRVWTLRGVRPVFLLRVFVIGYSYTG